MQLNLEAEQAVLGAILLWNDCLDNCQRLEAEHFHHPLHQRIFSVLQEKIQSGILSSIITVKSHFKNDQSYIEAGGDNYLASVATSAVSKSTVRNFSEIIIECAKKRRIEQIALETTEMVNSGDLGLTPETIIESVEQKLFDLIDKDSVDKGFGGFARAAAKAVKFAVETYQRDGGMSGISTGFSDLDGLLNGLNKTDLIILAGRPSMGKTSLATNIAYHVAKSGLRVGFFSLEMSEDQLSSRIISDASNVGQELIRTGNATENQMRSYIQVSNDLINLPLYTDDTPALQIGSLASRARRLKRQRGLDLLIVDYLQLLQAKTKNGRVNEVAEITQGLKAVAKELNIPVIALCQLSRQVENREDKRPQLSDLRDSGAIEQDADVVMFVYREEYYLSRTEPELGSKEYPEWEQAFNRSRNTADIIVGKARHSSIGTVKMHFNSAFTRFSDLSRPHMEGRA